MNEKMRHHATLIVGRLHDAVDELCRPLEALHVDRLRCGRGCAGCCLDELTVFEVEAAWIRQAVGEELRGQEPGAAGGCAFLSAQGACRIYAARPYVCRTQGLPLRWLERGEDGEPVEYRDICPLNVVEDEPLELLSAESLWGIGPFESKLAELQRAYAPQRPLARVSLRALCEELL